MRPPGGGTALGSALQVARSLVCVPCRVQPLLRWPRSLGIHSTRKYEAEFNTMREDMDALGIGASFTPLKPYDKWGPY